MRKSYTSTQLVAKEGWSYVCVTLALFLFSYLFSFFSWFFFLLFLATIALYRNPERIPEEDDERCIVSPIDGKIKNISKISLHDGSDVLCVVIKKRLCDVGILRAPFPMNVSEIKNKYGLFFSSSSSLFSILCERKSFTCDVKSSQIKLVVSAGQWSQPIAYFQKSGSYKAGERIGFLRDGEIALLLPLDSRIKVVLNDEVKAGMTVLGYLAYKDKNDK